MLPAHPTAGRLLPRQPIQVCCQLVLVYSVDVPAAAASLAAALEHRVGGAVPAVPEVVRARLRAGLGRAAGHVSLRLGQRARAAGQRAG